MYGETREIKYSDLAPNGDASLPAILRFYQDTAINHSAHAGYPLERLYGDDRAWILLSMNTDILRYPHYREQVNVTTYTTAFERCFGYRAFEITDCEGNILTTAASFWVFMDIKKGRPVRIYDDIPEKYGIEPKDTPEYIKREFETAEGADICDISVGKRDLDTNNHVNNVKLAEFLLEAMPIEAKIKKAQIYYKHAAYEGEILTVSACTYGSETDVRLIGDNKIKTYARFEIKE
ncbi:MAG: hypothetical protein IJT38_00165 [Clostridia bacterium]|nr:hypothetical protein [Clostridia bacterium]